MCGQTGFDAENTVSFLHPQVVWQVKLADPVPSQTLPCGNIGPFVGVTSTPIIDPASGALVLSAKTSNDGGATQQYQFFALHVSNGSGLPGFPVDVGAGQWRCRRFFQLLDPLEKRRQFSISNRAALPHSNTRLHVGGIAAGHDAQRGQPQARCGPSSASPDSFSMHKTRNMLALK